MKRLLATTLILATTNATASTTQHSHSALGELVARALEGRAQSQGLSDIQVEVFPLDGRVNLPKCGSKCAYGDRNPARRPGKCRWDAMPGPEAWTIYLRGRCYLFGDYARLSAAS